MGNLLWDVIAEQRRMAGRQGEIAALRVSFSHATSRLMEPDFHSMLQAAVMRIEGFADEVLCGIIARHVCFATLFIFNNCVRNPCSETQL